MSRQGVEVRQLKVGNKRRVWLLKTGKEKQPEFYVRNDYHGPIEVELKFDQFENVSSVPVLPDRFVIPTGRSESLLKVGAVNRFKPWNFSLKYRFTIGSPMARHNSSYLYSPPVETGSRYLVTQAFDGSFSHQDAQNKYAVDVAMPVGTPLYAAREGVVMEVENDFYKGGTDNRAYRSRSNSIRILHDDGSMAVYAHLELEKARVYPGQTVKEGQIIGFSGNTGYSSGPHLHFAIQVNKGMSLESIPFQFRKRNGEGITPVAGMVITGI